MTKEELLKPRYKVIADYPQSIWKEGQILPYFPEPYAKENIEKFPKVFRKMNWWEERKAEDMPEYIKFRDNVVIKVDNHFQEKLFVTDGSWPYRYSADHLIVTWEGVQYCCPYYDVMPATKDEFENQIKL